jgi:DNA-binding NtrC family response regulator
MSTVLCVGGESLHTRQPLLKSAGFEVVTATNEGTSLAAGRRTKLDAVILDSHSAISDLASLASALKCNRPSLIVVLVTDAGPEDAPQPLAAFDRVISRLDGPAALLAVLCELTSRVISTSGAAKISARETLLRSQELRRKMSALRQNMRRLREQLCHGISVWRHKVN